MIAYKNERFTKSPNDVLISVEVGFSEPNCERKKERCHKDLEETTVIQRGLSGAPTTSDTIHVYVKFNYNIW